MKLTLYILKHILDKLALLSFILMMEDFCFAGQLDDLDDLDDLILEPLEKKQTVNYKSVDSGKQLILFEDNIYLLDDDFDFGEDEFELQQLELNPDDIEIAKEYETFLNAFFSNSSSLGTMTPKSGGKDFNDLGLNNNPVTNSSIPSVNIPRYSPNRPSRGTMGFGVSSILGATIPITMNGFSASSNMGLRIDTPVSFNLAGFEAIVGIDGYISSFSSEFVGNYKYNMFNIIGNVSLFPLQSIELLQSIETRVGFGLNSMSYNNLSGMHPSFSFDINYYLPINISGFKFAVNLHGQRTFGYTGPGSLTELGDATDFMYLGLLINTPLAF